MTTFRKHSFLWVTSAFFLLSLGAHWALAWYAYVDEANAHHQPVSTREWAVQTGRDTFENWQSEFLQLVWQVGGLMCLYAVGSNQSKEGNERLEAKLDALLGASPEGRAALAELDRRFCRQPPPARAP
jgi:hypothetical protein